MNLICDFFLFKTNATNPIQIWKLHFDIGPWKQTEKKTFPFDHNNRFAIIIVCICVKTKIFLSNTFFVLFSLFEWKEISCRVLTKKNNKYSQNNCVNLKNKRSKPEQLKRKLLLNFIPSTTGCANNFQVSYLYHFFSVARR